MNINIKHSFSEDYGWEKVEVFVDNVRVSGLSTSSDSPEDNTCSRMGVVEAFTKLIEALYPQAKITIND